MKRRNISKSIAQQGGLMIEALAMLGLIAVVTPTMYKKSAERTMEVEDINTASTIRTIMNAANDYVGANYSTIIADMGETQATRPVTPEQISDYLPYKFDVGKALYNYGNPEITIVKQGNNLTTFALFPANANIGQERTSRIASLIGASGGYVTEAGTARGIGGIWRLEGDEYTNAFPDSGAGAAEYSIVTASADTINAATGNEIDMDKYLQRGRDNTDDPNDRSTWWKNTMRTDLYMGNVDNRNDVYNNSASTDTFSIRNIKSLIVGAENATADGSADNDSEYGLYISGDGLKPNAFIQGSITAAEQAFRADATRLGFGRFVDADGANEDFHFNVDTNGNTRADGSLTNLMDVNLASKLNDAGTGPAWTDVKIGALGHQYQGSDSYLIQGDHNHNPRGMVNLINENIASFQAVGTNDINAPGDHQSNSILLMGNGGYKKINLANGKNAATENIKAPSYRYTQTFPVRIGANTVAEGLLAAGQLDTQHLRASDFEVGSTNIDDNDKWMYVHNLGMLVAQPNADSAGRYSNIDKSNTRFNVNPVQIGLRIGSEAKEIKGVPGLRESSEHEAQIVLNKGGKDGKDDDVAANIKITAPVTDIRGTTDMTISGKGTLIQALNEDDFGVEDNFKNDLSENTIKLRNSDMQATMEGKQLTIEGRNKDEDVKTVFNSGAVDLAEANLNVTSKEIANFNISLGGSSSAPTYSNKMVFSVRTNKNAKDPSFYNKFEDDYDVTMHGNVLVGNSESGLEATGGKTAMIQSEPNRYYLSIGEYKNDAGINIVPVGSNRNMIIAQPTLKDEDKNILYMEQGATHARNDFKNADGSYTTNTNTGTIYIRKGYVEVRGNEYSDKKDLNADQGYGVISASRFVANNPGKKDDTTNSYGAKFPIIAANDFSNYNGANHNVAYDTYMVNPAYTSVMHDIKLTTRGGARLSDVLPDFINKGIYVVNNTISEATASKFKFDSDSNLYSEAKKVDEDLAKKTYDMSKAESWASPFMGVVPAPQCPPGYGRVITLTPASFEMGQAGLLREGENGRYFITPDTPSSTQAGEATKNPPRFEKISVEGKVDVTTNSGADTVTISAGSGGKGTLNTTSYVLNYTTPSTSTGKDSATKPNAPLMFQQSTRLKSMVKELKSETKVDGKYYTQGWAAIMGFLYPGKMYSAFGAGNDDDLYWNVFPVIRGTMEAYATVYCYFDRTNLFAGYTGTQSGFIDSYRYMQDMTGSPSPNKVENGDYINRLNDPALKYNEAW